MNPRCLASPQPEPWWRSRQVGVLGSVVLLLAAACGTPTTTRPLLDRQDPARFEQCADPAGKLAWEQALVHIQAGREREALPLLREVVERCPEQVLAMAHYQDAALHLGGEAAQAMRSFYEQLPDDPESPVPAFAKARLQESVYVRSGLIDTLIERHPDFAYGYLAQGRLNRVRGRLADAAASFQKAIARHPQLLAAHVELAEVLCELGRHAEARLPYENYLRGAPNDRATMHAFVQLLLYRLNKPEDARPWIDRLLADDPQDEAALMDRAAADWRSSRFDEALQGYLDVLRKRPDRARAALNIGYLHYDAYIQTDADKQVHWPKARKAFQLFLLLIRPEDGLDYFEKVLAVPYRLQEIDRLLGPGDSAAPTLEDLK